MIQFPLSHFEQPDTDRKQLWDAFREMQRESEAYKVANGVYNVRTAPGLKQINAHEEKKLYEQTQCRY